MENIKININSWDDAFKALLPTVRQQSVRVAAYTSVIYTVALNNGFAKDNKNFPKRISGSFTETAYKCGLYHQLGKALVPEEYQIFKTTFSKEEKALYEKYPIQGRLLISKLQEATRNNSDVIYDQKESHTDNIPWLMIREAAGSHKERYDGKGYPKGLKGDEISPIAQIVSLAKMFDQYCSENASEHPFDEAVEMIRNLENSYYSPALIAIFNKSIKKCYEVYQKYIDYTLTIPEIIELVDEREKRPLGLDYYPVVNDLKQNVVAYKAIPYFKGYYDNLDEKCGYQQIKDVLIRTEMLFDSYEYFLYELTDSALRLRNCKLEYPLIMELPSEFLKSKKFNLTYLDNIFQTQQISKDDIYFEIDSNYLLNTGKGLQETIIRLLNNHYQLILTNYLPENMGLSEINHFGFNNIGFDSSCDHDETIGNIMKQYNSLKLNVIGYDCDCKESLEWYLDNGCKFITGPYMGAASDEESIIKELLIKHKGTFEN